MDGKTKHLRSHKKGSEQTQGSGEGPTVSVARSWLCGAVSRGTPVGPVVRSWRVRGTRPQGREAAAGTLLRPAARPPPARRSRPPPHAEQAQEGADGQEPALWAEEVLIGGVPRAAPALSIARFSGVPGGGRWTSQERFPCEVHATGTTGVFPSMWEGPQALHRPWHLGLGHRGSHGACHPKELAVEMGLVGGSPSL